MLKNLSFATWVGWKMQGSIWVFFRLHAGAIEVVDGRAVRALAEELVAATIEDA